MIKLESEVGIYEQIKQYSREKKITISELCRRAEIPRGTIARLKKREPPSVTSLRIVAKILSNLPKPNQEND